MRELKPENVHYSVDKEKKTVVCWVDHTRDLFLEFLEDNFSMDICCLFDYKVLDKLRMNNRFSGKSVCSEDDEFDEELGRLIAYHRMREKMHASFFTKVSTFFDIMEDALDDFEDTALAYKIKLDTNGARRANIINKKLGE